jgi:hypothetical protein
VDHNLILAEPQGYGFTWTLTSRLGEMLFAAEAELGQRDMTFTILGVEFTSARSQIWLSGKAKNVIVQLSQSVMQDPIGAYFLLAHECIHLIDPAMGQTNYLEEGVATAFSIDYIQSTFDTASEAGEVKYAAACEMVRKMQSIRRDAAMELRRQYGPLQGITEQQILSVCPTLDASTAKLLASPFWLDGPM